MNAPLLLYSEFIISKNSVTDFVAKFTTIMAQIKQSTDIDVETIIILKENIK